jgi:dihydroorotase
LTVDNITIIKPDDWHVHLRDKLIMRAVIEDTAINFGRAVVMPNLNPPILNVADALSYKDRLLMALELLIKTKKENLDQKKHSATLKKFQPLMTIYLSENISFKELEKIAKSESIIALKYYPAGATTNSQFGVKDLKNCYKIFERMSQLGIVLCIHGEVVNSDIDIFDREKKFIDDHLIPLRKEFPELKIVFEHVSTIEAVEYILGIKSNLAATITPQHLIFNRNDLLVGGIRPHRYCAPILKTEKDRVALVMAATSGDPRFFLGTDSAPHLIGEKESNCGCAGCYSAPHAIPLYLEIFEAENRLTEFEKFASLNGPNFYGLPINSEKIKITKTIWTPDSLVEKSKFEKIIPLAYKRALNWRVDH